jgi:hypothetical protein
MRAVSIGFGRCRAPDYAGGYRAESYLSEHDRVEELRGRHAVTGMSCCISGMITNPPLNGQQLPSPTLLQRTGLTSLTGRRSASLVNASAVNCLLFMPYLRQPIYRPLHGIVNSGGGGRTKSTSSRARSGSNGLPAISLP